MLRRFRIPVTKFSCCRPGTVHIKQFTTGRSTRYLELCPTKCTTKWCIIWHWTSRSSASNRSSSAVVSLCSLLTKAVNLFGIASMQTSEPPDPAVVAGRVPCIRTGRDGWRAASATSIDGSAAMIRRSDSPGQRSRWHGRPVRRLSPDIYPIQRNQRCDPSQVVITDWLIGRSIIPLNDRYIHSISTQRIYLLQNVFHSIIQNVKIYLFYLFIYLHQTT